MNYRFLAYELSETDFCLSREGQRIPLEPKALRVLMLLVSRAGRLVDKQELLESVWPDTFVEENTLTRTIANLRRQLGDSSRDSKLIETVPTRGYRFIAAVEIMPAPGTVPSPAPAPEPSGQTEYLVARSETAVDAESVTNAKAISESLPTSTAGMPRIGIPRRRWLLLAGCLSLVAILGLWIWYGRLHTEAPIHSLAVLPLEDLSPGTREDYFADGTTDELITELARIPGLRVVSRTSVMQDKGNRKSLTQIAGELNVDAVVEGSVVRAGDRVRITAQLIDTRSDQHLWAHTFEEPAGDILSLQDNVAREIALQTSAALTPVARAGMTNARHVNPEAHDDYLRGLYFVQRRDGDLAVSYFRKAINLEPDYAAANAGLAEALVTKVLGNGEHAAEIMPSAIAAARRAIQLDPYSGEAYTALGAIDLTYLYDWNGAEQNLRKGIELSPSSSDAETWYAIYLVSVGRPEEAVNAVQRGVALDPLSFWANRLLGSVLYYSRRYDESLVALKRASEIAPDKFEFVEGWNSGIYEIEGRYSDAFEADLKDMASQLSAQDVDSFRSAFQTGGWKAYQEARVKFLLPRSMSECHMNPIAMSYLRLGNVDETFRWLNRDMDNRCGRTVFDLSADPRLDKIRQDPRFAALRRRANLPH
jgi:TolB-like protein/DNA-binding winged helix-turn-helix (wHTH) protein/cytochrome c-type biogenesis protein CcmH/NrfG